MMFLAQIIALPIYLKLIKVKSKRFAYITGAIVWIVVALFMLFLPAEGAVDKGGIEVVNGAAKTLIGAPDWLLIAFGLLLGLGIGGTVFVPHSSFGDVCDVGELYFGERTEGSFSGLTNFLNTTAQAIGLAIPPLIIGLTGYVETQYRTAEEYANLLTQTAEQQAADLGMSLDNFKIAEGNGVIQFLPLSQPEAAQQAIKLTFILLPVAILILAIIIAARYKLTSKLQAQIVELNARKDKDSEEFAEQRRELLQQVGENVNKLPEFVYTPAEPDLEGESSKTENETSANDSEK